MILKGFEIKQITNDEEFTRAENFVDQLDHHSLDENEVAMLLILSEYMRQYDEENIIPQYRITSKDLIEIKTQKFEEYLKRRLSEEEIKQIESESEEEFKKLSCKSNNKYFLEILDGINEAIEYEKDPNNSSLRTHYASNEGVEQLFSIFPKSYEKNRIDDDKSSDNTNNIIASLVSPFHFLIQFRDPSKIGFGLRNPNYIQILQHRFDIKRKIFLESTFCFDNRHGTGKDAFIDILSSEKALNTFSSKVGIIPLKNQNNIIEHLGIIHEEKFTLFNAFKINGYFEIEDLELFNLALSNGLGSRRSYGMSAIRLMEVEANLSIQGIFNYNGTEKTKEGYKNHKGAKMNSFGIDFTSSRCLRYEMFKDLQPKQPISTEFKSNYIQLASSEIGLLRGIMDADNQLKRSSPLSVLDAYTISDKKIVFFDQGSSSKPNEKLDTKRKGSDETKSDISMFSCDNAHLREQKFRAFINMQQLQFIEQGKDQDQIVLEKDEQDFLKNLRTTFKNLKATESCEIGSYSHTNAISPTAIRGILLSDDQITALIESAILRMVNIYGFKAGSFIKANKDSFKIKLILDDALDTSHEYNILMFAKIEVRSGGIFIRPPDESTTHGKYDLFTVELEDGKKERLLRIVKKNSIEESDIRSKEQIDLSKKIAEHKMTICSVDPGAGKTSIALYWHLLNYQKNPCKLIFALPKQVQVTGVFETISRDLERICLNNSDISIEGVFSGKRQYVSNVSDGSNLLSSDINIMVFDRLLSPCYERKQFGEFISALRSNLVLDEFHEFCWLYSMIEPLKEIIKIRKWINNGAKTLFLSGTPDPSLIRILFGDDSSDNKIMIFPRDSLSPMNTNKSYLVLKDTFPDNIPQDSLVSFNTVANSQEYMLNKDLSNILHVHSKFTESDKKEKIYEILSEHSENCSDKITVTAKILQSSFNLNYKNGFLVCSHPNTDAQTWGRINRFDNKYNGYIIMILESEFSIFDDNKLGHKSINKRWEEFLKSNISTEK
ncbi:unnamed protein product, partial [Diamesa hyperborea]